MDLEKLDKVLAESLDGIEIYLHYRLALQQIAEGTASQVQLQFVNAYWELVRQNRTRYLLKQMRTEAANIQEQKRKFKSRWGRLPFVH